MGDSELLLFFCLLLALCCTSIFIISVSAYFALLCWKLRTRKKRVALSTHDEQVRDISSIVTEDTQFTVELEEETLSSDDNVVVESPHQESVTFNNNGESPESLTV